MHYCLPLPTDKLRLVSGHVTVTLTHLLNTSTDNQVIERVIGGLCQILEQCRDIALPIWVDQGIPIIEQNLPQMFSLIEDEVIFIVHARQSYNCFGQRVMRAYIYVHFLDFSIVCDNRSNE